MVAGRVESFEEFLMKKIASGEAPALSSLIGGGTPQSQMNNAQLQSRGPGYGSQGVRVAPAQLPAAPPPAMPMQSPIPYIQPQPTGQPQLSLDPLYAEMVAAGATPMQAMELVKQQGISNAQQQQHAQQQALLATPQTDESGQPVVDPLVSALGWAGTQMDRPQNWVQDRDAEQAYEFMVIVDGGKQAAIDAGFLDPSTTDEQYAEIRKQKIESVTLAGYAPLTVEAYDEAQATGKPIQAIKGVTDTPLVDYLLLTPQEKENFRRDATYAWNYGYRPQQQGVTPGAGFGATPTGEYFEPGPRALHELWVGDKGTLDRIINEIWTDPTNLIGAEAAVGKAAVRSGSRRVLSGAVTRRLGQEAAEAGVEGGTRAVIRGTGQQVAGHVIRGTGAAIQVPNIVLNTVADQVISAPFRAVKAVAGEVPGLRMLTQQQPTAAGMEFGMAVNDSVSEAMPDTTIAPSSFGQQPLPGTGPQGYVPPQAAPPPPGGYGPSPTVPEQGIGAPDQNVGPGVGRTMPRTTQRGLNVTPGADVEPRPGIFTTTSPLGETQTFTNQRDALNWRQTGVLPEGHPASVRTRTPEQQAAFEQAQVFPREDAIQPELRPTRPLSDSLFPDMPYNDAKIREAAEELLAMPFESRRDFFDSLDLTPEEAESLFRYVGNDALDVPPVSEVLDTTTTTEAATPEELLADEIPTDTDVLTPEFDVPERIGPEMPSQQVDPWDEGPPDILGEMDAFDAGTARRQAEYDAKQVAATPQMPAQQAVAGEDYITNIQGPTDWIPEGEDFKWVDPEYTGKAQGKAPGSPLLRGNGVQHVVTDLNMSPEYRPLTHRFGREVAPMVRQHIQNSAKASKYADPANDSIAAWVGDPYYTSAAQAAENVRIDGELMAKFREIFGDDHQYVFNHGDELNPEYVIPKKYVGPNQVYIKTEARQVVPTEGGGYRDYNPSVDPPETPKMTVLRNAETGEDLPLVRNIANLIEHAAFDPVDEVATAARYTLTQMGMRPTADIAKEARRLTRGVSSLSESAQRKLRAVTFDGKSPRLRATLPGNPNVYVDIQRVSMKPTRWEATLIDTSSGEPIANPLGKFPDVNKAKAAARDALEALPEPEMRPTSMSSGFGPPPESDPGFGQWWVMEPGYQPKTGARGRLTRESTTEFLENGRPKIEQWAGTEQRKPRGASHLAKAQDRFHTRSAPANRQPVDTRFTPAGETGGLRTIFEGLSNEANNMLNTKWGMDRINDPTILTSKSDKKLANWQDAAKYDGMTTRQVFKVNHDGFSRIQTAHSWLKERGFSPDNVGVKKTSVTDPAYPKLSAAQKNRLMELIGTTDGNKAMAMMEAEWNRFLDPGKALDESDPFHVARRRTSWDASRSVNPDIDRQLPLALDMLHSLIYRMPRALLLADPLSTWTYTMRNLMSNTQMMTSANPSWMSSKNVWKGMSGAFDENFIETSLAADAERMLFGPGAKLPTEFGREVEQMDEAIRIYGKSPTEKMFTESAIGKRLGLRNVSRPFNWKRNLDIRLERAMKIGGGYMPLLKGEIAREIPNLSNEMVAYAAKNGVPVTATGIEDTLWSLRDPATGVFGRHDVYDSFYRNALEGGAAEDVAAKFADRAARNWTNRAKAARGRAIEQTNRIFPSNLKRTNLDHYASWVTLFHFWPTRAGKFLVEEMIRHPQLAMNWYRAHEGVERMAEEGGYPASVQGLIKLWQSPWGFVLYSNPATLFLVTAFQPEIQNQDQREDVTGVGEWLLKLRKATGLQPIPMLDATLNAFGVYGDMQAPDVLPSRTLDLALAAYDYALVQSGHSLHDPVVDQAKENMREWVTSHSIPWGSGTIEAGDAAGYNEDQIASRVLQIDPDLANRMTKKNPDGTFTADAALAQEEFHQIMEGESDPRYAQAEKEVAIQNLVPKVVNLGVPFSVRAKSTDRERTLELAKAGRKTIEEGGTPTPEEMAAIEERSIIVGSNEQRELGAQQAAYKALGTEEQRQVQEGWTLIAFGDQSKFENGEYLIVNGREYYIPNLVRMSEDERIELADEWVAEVGYTDSLESFRDLRDEEKAKLPEYAAYLDWSKLMRGENPGDLERNRQSMMDMSPGYRNYIQRLPADTLADPAKFEGASLSMDAYLASLGKSGSIYDKPPGDALDPSAIDPSEFLPSDDEEGGSGTGKKKEPKTEMDLLEQLQDDQKKWEEDLAKFNEKVVQITGGPRYEDLAPMWQDSLKKRLAREGIDVPSEPTRVRQYREWVSMREGSGQPTDPMAYIAWLVESDPSLLAVAESEPQLAGSTSQ